MAMECKFVLIRFVLAQKDHIFSSFFQQKGVDFHLEKDEHLEPEIAQVCFKALPGYPLIITMVPFFYTFRDIVYIVYFQVVGFEGFHVMVFSPVMITHFSFPSFHEVAVFIRSGKDVCNQEFSGWL